MVIEAGLESMFSHSDVDFIIVTLGRYCCIVHKVASETMPSRGQISLFLQLHDFLGELGALDLRILALWHLMMLAMLSIRL